MDEDGYHELPGSRQWPAWAKKPVDKSKWQECEECGRKTPVVKRTDTYVCPHCGHSHVGVEDWSDNVRRQATCHVCETELGENYQCPKCSYPRGWMRVDCPFCGNKQPVNAPHWVVGCDLFTLECVKCESQFISLCIC